MKQHVIIARVYDHSITPRIFEKVCRSKSAAIREARDLNQMALIRRYAGEYDAELDKFVFVPKSHFERDDMGNLMVFATNSYCSVAIEVIDMDGNSVNVCSYGGCQDYDDEHLCETPDECNCKKVWAELKARGFDGKFHEVEDTTEQAEEPAEKEAEDTTMQPTIYSTKSAITGKEPICQVKSYDKVLVQFTNAIITDTRTGEERNEGFRSVVCIVSKFGNLFVYYGLTSRGKSLESCKRSTNRLLRKAYGMELDAAISEGETLEQMHASFTDESVHENFKQWAASLFE